MSNRPLILFLSLLIICPALPVLGSQSGVNEYFTRSGKSISVTESHSSGQSLSNILVESKGFAHNISENFEDHDPIQEILVGDLDENGFDEFYIVTVSSGSGSYAGLLAFASNKDKSLSLIHFPDIQEGDERFTGYLGHDTFGFADGALVRSFPIYLPSDTNNKPTGGTKAIIYRLYRNGIFIVDNSTTFNIKYSTASGSSQGIAADSFIGGGPVVIQYSSIIGGLSSSGSSPITFLCHATDDGANLLAASCL